MVTLKWGLAAFVTVFALSLYWRLVLAARAERRRIATMQPKLTGDERQKQAQRLLFVTLTDAVIGGLVVGLWHWAVA